MEKEDVADALQQGVIDYNKWVDNKAGPLEEYIYLRGVLFNKIQGTLKQKSGFNDLNKDFYGRAMEPENLLAIFEKARLTALKVDIWKENYCSGHKLEFLRMLSDCTETLVYDSLKDEHYYKIASIVEQLKAYKL